ncbi:MAG: hypothetical protein A3K19_28320 [Lentisphaerae bacterium RIFOXYB12_FULL_65_16]|nr:MAG: hypothetical protein A3K18_19570 [Lentisphaerae bacterium RIFOXYA12_64_32]OGV85495.1 MAG: hypothetical protein A3K19_28320 [Lentisphaerae bacterium RIFOXYB12_FULL_65_16]
MLEELGPKLNRTPDLETMPFDLPVHGDLQFEDLAGLFASTPLDHAVVFMTIRQTAYLFGLVRRMDARNVLEIGRYKGGSTFAIAAAMRGQGQFWSVDLGEKEARLKKDSAPAYDNQIRDICKRFGLRVNMLVGDARTIQIETGELDLVFIDGDHSYDGVKNDFQRFGRRVRLGGAVLFDDAVPGGLFEAHTDTVGRLVREIEAEGEFRLVKSVNRLAHMERAMPRRK